MMSFRDLDRHFGSTKPSMLRELTALAEARGRQEAFRKQNPAGLETLRKVALIQSTEASNAIENIHIPHARLEQLMADRTAPENRSEQVIAGYRFALDQIHANAKNIPFEPRYVEQIHGYLARFTGDRTAGRWKGLDNTVEEVHPDGTKVVRFAPVSAGETPAAMRELHERFNAAVDGDYEYILLVAAYLLDFLVIHPFRDGNGRMARLIALWLMYLGEYEVGRYISVERLIEETKETYYESLGRSTTGWHSGEHNLAPWVEYFVGTLNAAYKQFEDRTDALGGRGTKQGLVRAFIRSSLGEFTIEDLRRGAPNVSDSYLSRTLNNLKKDGVLERLGEGRGARWRRIKDDF